ncbi:MAG: hypothetical protein AAB339_09030, partial [Elusimicrobiota bacterium]
MISYKKATALSLVASLLLEGPLSAQVARTVLLPSGGSGVPAVAPGSIAQPLTPGFRLPSQFSAGTFLPPASFQAPGLSAPAAIKGASLALPPAAVHAAGLTLQASEKGPATPSIQEEASFSRQMEPASLGKAEGTRLAPATLRERLVHAAAAIAQNPVSRAFFPGLSRLGARTEDASRTENPSLQKTQAESQFGLKAFGSEDGAQGDAETSAAPVKTAPAQSPSAEAGAEGWRNDGKPGDYPVRQIPFNGKTLPSTAIRPDSDIAPRLVDANAAAKKH